MVSHYPKTRRDNFQVPSWGPPGRHGHGSLFLSAAWNLRPDAVTFGKSMASGRGAIGFGHSHCSHCQSRYFNDLISLSSHLFTSSLHLYMRLSICYDLLVFNLSISWHPCFWLQRFLSELFKMVIACYRMLSPRILRLGGAACSGEFRQPGTKSQHMRRLQSTSAECKRGRTKANNSVFFILLWSNAAGSMRWIAEIRTVALDILYDKIKTQQQ